jgi:N-methylhydantoinase B
VLEAGWLVEVTAVECLSKLAACSGELMREAQAAPAGGPDQFVLSGRNQHGDRFTHVIFDCIATGGGAYAHRDGVWTQGQHNIERLRIANVESTELEVPVVYLSRGLVADSGGAGRNRGGLSIGSTYFFRGSDDLLASCSGHGWEVPNSNGIFGGFPGTENDREWITDNDAEAFFARGAIPAPADLAGERPEMHGRQGLFRLAPGQVLTNVHQAGGGWGDPLDRPAAAVQRDLDHAAITADAAQRLYGAVLVDGRVDEPATAARREQERARRRAWPTTAALPEVPDGPRVPVGPLGDQLELVQIGTDRFVSCRCGTVLATGDGVWRAHAALEVTRDAHDVSRAHRLAPGLEIRRYACPACGVLHATDVARRDDPHLQDLLLLPA